MASRSFSATWEITCSCTSGSPATSPAAAAASMPLRYPVLGTTTLFTFLMMFPLHSTRHRSGRAPRAWRTLAAP